MQHDQCGVYKVYFSLIKLQWIKESATSVGIHYKVYMKVWLTSKYATKNVQSVHYALTSYVHIVQLWSPRM